MAHLTPKLTAQSKLDDLAIPHWETVLEEVFLIAPARFYEQSPARLTTVADLVVASELVLDEVLRRLRSLIKMSDNIEISPQELAVLLAETNSAGVEAASSDVAAGGVVLLDVRANWEFKLAHLPGSLLLAELDFGGLLGTLLAKQPEVVTICHHGVRSYSAAMYLKAQGLSRVRSLSGGVEGWALSCDPSMARY